jgi:hypothetical protein
MNQFRKRGVINQPVSDLAKKFGVSQQAVSFVLKDYFSKHDLIKSKFRGENYIAQGNRPPGRAATFYELDNQAVAEHIFGDIDNVDASGILNSSHPDGFEKYADLIAKLLTLPSYMELSIPEAMLLSILLCFSDELGCVRNLSFKDFELFIGMKKTKLKSTLKSLQEKKLLLSIWAGGVSPGVFGKINSVYVLNSSRFNASEIFSAKERRQPNIIPVEPLSVDFVCKIEELSMHIDRCIKARLRKLKADSANGNSLDSCTKLVKEDLQSGIGSENVSTKINDLWGNLNKPNLCVFYNLLNWSDVKRLHRFLKLKIEDYSSMYSLNPNGDEKFEDYIFQELIPADGGDKLSELSKEAFLELAKLLMFFVKKVHSMVVNTISSNDRKKTNRSDPAGGFQSVLGMKYVILHEGTLGNCMNIMRVV